MGKKARSDAARPCVAKGPSSAEESSEEAAGGPGVAVDPCVGALWWRGGQRGEAGEVEERGGP